MKNLIAIILFLSSLSSFGASKTGMNLENSDDKVKMYAAAYQIAQTHFPDENMANAKISETCNGEWEEFVADVENGQDPYLVPAGYSRQVYYTDIGKDYLVYRCKRGTDANERTIGKL